MTWSKTNCHIQHSAGDKRISKGRQMNSSVLFKVWIFELRLTSLTNTRTVETHIHGDRQTGKKRLLVIQKMPSIWHGSVETVYCEVSKGERILKIGRQLAKLQAKEWQHFFDSGWPSAHFLCHHLLMDTHRHQGYHSPDRKIPDCSPTFPDEIADDIIEQMHVY